MYSFCNVISYVAARISEGFLYNTFEHSNSYSMEDATIEWRQKDKNEI